MHRIPPSPSLVLVALAAILVAACLHTYDEPLQTDITGAAVIGHEILAGRALCADMWGHKTPRPHAPPSRCDKARRLRPEGERKLAREIDTLLLPGESFYEWGSEGGLYYL